MINFLKNYLSKNSLYILDVGCGGGANIYWLEKNFPRCKFTGMDIDKEALDLARKMNSESENVDSKEVDFLQCENFFPVKIINQRLYRDALV